MLKFLTKINHALDKIVSNFNADAKLLIFQHFKKHMTVPQPICTQESPLPAMYLPGNIRLLRRKLSLSQEELAALIGLNRGNIASYENGSAEPRICNLLKLSHIFGISVIDLAQKDLSLSELENISDRSMHPGTVHDKALLQQFHERAEEISKVIHSLHTCFQFKIKSIPDTSPEIQAIRVHFEQMREASQSLIADHLALLEHLRRSGQ
jgi:transcriptional regulator with XRE-family HTH domain